MTNRGVVAAAIARHPRSAETPETACESVGEIMTRLAARHPHPDLITADEADAAIAAIARAAGVEGRTAKDLEKAQPFGGQLLYVGRGRLRIQTDTTGGTPARVYMEDMRHSPYAPGLHDAAVEAADAPVRVMAALGKALEEVGYDGPGVGRMRWEDGSRTGHPTSYGVTRELPEGGGETWTRLAVGHLCEYDMARSLRRTAREIDMRWRNRHEIRERIDGAFAVARDMLADQEGMEALGAKASWFHVRDGGIDFGVLVTVRMMDDTMRIVEQGVHVSDGKHGLRDIRRRMRQNARMVEKLAGGAPGESWTVSPILAAALLAADPRYAGDLLAECETATGGARYVKTRNPRLRGISNMSMTKGRLDGRVNLAKGVYYRKERLHLEDVRVPDTFLRGVTGLPLTDIVDHPFLRGLTARSATVNSIGFCIRPDQDDVPLRPVMESLRAKATEHDARAKSAPARSGTRKGGSRTPGP